MKVRFLSLCVSCLEAFRWASARCSGYGKCWRATITGRENAETASRATACRHLFSRLICYLRAFPWPRASSDRAPARRPLDVPRPLQRADVRGLGGSAPPRRLGLPFSLTGEKLGPL